MANEMQQSLVEMVEKMPPFPKSVHRIIGMANDINCAPKDLVQVVEHDPVVTMKLLKLVNSAFFGLQRSISSVRHALVYLGLNTVKNLALTIATVDALPRKQLENFNTSAFLLHSLTTASIAQQLARRYRVPGDATDAFVAGLLHDFGKMVFALYASDRFAAALLQAKQEQRPLHEIEVDLFGEDHSEVGAMLAEHWELPAELTASIRNHHAASGEGSLGDCVFIADQISKQLGFGVSGNPVIAPLPEGIQAKFGASLEAIVASLGGLEDEVEKANAFILM